MKLTFSENNCYIPSFEGNNKLPDSEKIKVYWRYPNSEETKDIRKRSNPKINYSGGKLKADEIEIEIIVDELAAVKMLVTNIENLTINGQIIKDGAVLVKSAGMNSLVSEIATEIISNMDKVKSDSKN